MIIDASQSLCSLPRSIVPVGLLFLSSPPSVSFERSDGSNPTKGIWPPHSWENHFYSDEWCISPSHPKLLLLKVRPQDKSCGQRHQRHGFLSWWNSPKCFRQRTAVANLKADLRVVKGCGWCLGDPTIIRRLDDDGWICLRAFNGGEIAEIIPDNYQVYQGILQFALESCVPNNVLSNLLRFGTAQTT